MVADTQIDRPKADILKDKGDTIEFPNRVMSIADRGIKIRYDNFQRIRSFKLY